MHVTDMSALLTPEVIKESAEWKWGRTHRGAGTIPPKAQLASAMRVEGIECHFHMRGCESRHVANVRMDTFSYNARQGTWWRGTWAVCGAKWDYEQWIGVQAASLCERSAITWENKGTQGRRVTGGLTDCVTISGCYLRQVPICGLPPRP